MKNEHVNHNQQAQEKLTRKTKIIKWLWRFVRLVDIVCRLIEKFEGGE